MKILEPIRTVEILVLDDLGASKPSDWVRDIVGIVLNARYNENRTTIITTNYLDNPATEGETARLPKRQADFADARRFPGAAHRIRMRSRLYEMCRTVEVSAPDFRREKTQAGPRARVTLTSGGLSMSSKSLATALLFCLLASTRSVCAQTPTPAGTPSETFRDPFTVKFQFDDKHKVERRFDKTPYVSEKTVHVFPGEEFG